MTIGRAVVVAALGAATTALLAAGTASAHSLASSTVTVQVAGDNLVGTISLAVGALDQAFDTAHRSDVLTASEYADQAIAYLDDHLVVTGSDGSTWPERYVSLSRLADEGMETLTVEITVEAAGDDPSRFTISYDAIIEAVPDHDTVLVFIDDSNQASTPGVFTADDHTIDIGAGAPATGVIDTIGYGFRHVLDGADHLLFLIALVLPAPLAAVAGRWEPGRRPLASIRRVAHVVTAFTLGHSATLVATAVGWIDLPSRPIEVLIAASVAVSAIHAIRPLARRGEPIIAATFGLVHGLAFAGILTELGLDGSRSLVTLLAFNVGIELAQLSAVACLFPSLLVMSTRASYGTVRLVGAAISLTAALAWMSDRLGLATNPFDALEQNLIDHKVGVVVAVALAAGLLYRMTRPLSVMPRADDRVTPAATTQLEHSVTAC